MRFILKTILIFCFLISNSNSKDGYGDLKFTSSNFNHFIQYLKGDGDLTSGGKPLGFAINQAGNQSWYYYCPKKYGDNCMTGAAMQAQNKCTIASKKKGGERCFVFAKGRTIVWDKKYIKIKRKTTYEEIKKIFSENGWYN